MRLNRKMPIQLHKILADIAEEKVLHPNFPDATKKDVDEAWSRVGRSSKLSVHEVRSIFKVLQKKYDQEKCKDRSTWKLYHIMEEIHEEGKDKNDVKEEEMEIRLEDDEEYEMLEVHEEDEHAGFAHPTSQSVGSTSSSESPTKSFKSNSSSHSSPEKEEFITIKPSGHIIKTKAISATATSSNAGMSNVSSTDEKKLLNTMASTSRSSAASQTPSATAAALHKKGITVKKSTAITTNLPPGTKITASISATPVRNTTGSITVRAGGRLLEVGKTIQLPEAIKRKLSEDQMCTIESKKISLSQLVHSNAAAAAIKTSPAQNPHTIHNTHNTHATHVTHAAHPTHPTHPNTTPLVQIKQEKDDDGIVNTTRPQAMNIITIPGNHQRSELVNGMVGIGGGGAASSTAATVASTSTNGFSPRIEDIDYRNDIIFEGPTGAINGAATGKLCTNGSEVINLGNFDNSLPPTFFKNLCNSSRHEALGLYVANVMNRLRPRSAAKLELGILRAIIDVQADEMEQ